VFDSFYNCRLLLLIFVVAHCDGVFCTCSMLFKESRTTHQKWTSSQLVVVIQVFFHVLSQLFGLCAGYCCECEDIGIKSAVALYWLCSVVNLTMFIHSFINELI